MGRTAGLGMLPLEQLGNQARSLYPHAALGHMTTRERENKVAVKVHHTGGSGSRNTPWYRHEMAMNMDADSEVCFKEEEEGKKMKEEGAAEDVSTIR